LRMEEATTRDLLHSAPKADYANTRIRLFNQLTHSTAANTLRRSTIELGSLVETIGKPPTVGKATDQYISHATAFLGCVSANTDFTESCSDKYDDLVSYAKVVVNSYGQRADEHLAEQR